MGERLIVATHEAGHCCVALALGKPAAELSLTEGGGGQFKESVGWEPRPEHRDAKLVSRMQAVVQRTPHTAPDLLPRVSAIVLGEMPTVTSELVDSARSFALRVEVGSEPLRAPRAPEPEPVIVPVERQKVYTLSPICWREANGQVLTAAKHTWAEPPLGAAQRAIEVGLADLPDSPRTQRLLTGFGVSHSAPPSPDDCTSLDAVQTGEPAPLQPGARTLPE